MLLNQWKEHREDGHVYRLTVLREYERTETGYIPRLLHLEACPDYIPASKALNPHPLDRPYVKDEDVYEVSNEAFNDFDHLATFAKEVGEILECDPATIIRAI